MCAVVISTTVAVAAGGAVSSADEIDADRIGWWQRANSESVPVPPPPGIPEDDFVVASAGSDVSMMSAIGFPFERDQTRTVESFDLRIHEDDTAAGNQNSAAGAILACPITAFWAAVENGAWEKRPTFDCDLASVNGTRGRDGSWTFDLRPIGLLWNDPFGEVAPDGVALIPDVERMGGPFEAVFLSSRVEVDLTTEPVPTDFAEAVPEDPKTDVGLSTVGTPGAGPSLFSPPVVAAPPAVVESPTVEDLQDEPTAEEIAAAQPSAPRLDRRDQFLGNWSPLLAIGLVVAAAAFLAMSMWIGPSGEPDLRERRGGVSRALDAQLRAEREASVR